MSVCKLLLNLLLASCQRDVIQSMMTSLLLETVGRKIGNCDALRGLCDRKLLQTIDLIVFGMLTIL